ncbi:hypothetical protein Vadar_010332 [Vaccinium darrowii]|uniref:Uncharacterized protein n=1 Tax=Vaccinium darrowii TaxID=229202 RepID=A0ACB7YE59_9ERIC|nr:hypothetical protein Vadar_010332 [Vaccinium darrowii]
MQVETLSKDDLASRLTLTADIAASVGPLLLSDSLITIMECTYQLDYRTQLAYSSSNL